MKIVPMTGFALVQKVKKDFETAGTREKPIILPQGGKASTFFNRAKLLDLCRSADQEANPRFAELSAGDIVILSSTAGQFGVPGQIKNEAGRFVEVLLTPIHDIIAKIEGDEAEEDAKSSIISGPSGGIN